MGQCCGKQKGPAEIDLRVKSCEQSLLEWQKGLVARAETLEEKSKSMAIDREMIKEHGELVKRLQKQTEERIRTCEQNEKELQKQYRSLVHRERRLAMDPMERRFIRQNVAHEYADDLKVPIDPIQEAFNLTGDPKPRQYIDHSIPTVFYLTNVGGEWRPKEQDTFIARFYCTFVNGEEMTLWYYMHFAQDTSRNDFVHVGDLESHEQENDSRLFLRDVHRLGHSAHSLPTIHFQVSDGYLHALCLFSRTEKRKSLAKIVSMAWIKPFYDPCDR